MTLNITSQYALKVVSYMSLEPKNLYSVKYLSETLEIPYKYLTKIMTKLSKSNIVSSIKGRNGGFVLSKNIDELKVKDVFMALEDNSYKLCILGTGLCDQSKKCQLHDTWKEPKNAVEKNFLEKTFVEIGL